MYYYIYDTLAQSKEMQKELARIESRLLDYGIKDKVAKISPLRSVRDAVSEAYKHKFDTIIAVGGDPLVLEILKFVVGYSFVLGIIPLGQKTLIGSLFSMPAGAQSCELISARKIQVFSVGKADDEFFFSSCNIFSGVTSFSVGGTFTVECPPESLISITNCGTPPKEFGIRPPNPQDGRFNIAVLNKKNGLFSNVREKEVSFWRSQSVKLRCEKGFVAELDGVRLTKPLNSFQALPQAIKCIVGKTITSGGR